jgi:hypothetical protein
MSRIDDLIGIWSMRPKPGTVSGNRMDGAAVARRTAHQIEDRLLPGVIARRRARDFPTRLIQILRQVAILIQMFVRPGSIIARFCFPTTPQRLPNAIWVRCGVRIGSRRPRWCARRCRVRPQWRVCSSQPRRWSPSCREAEPGDAGRALGAAWVAGTSNRPRTTKALGAPGPFWKA